MVEFHFQKEYEYQNMMYAEEANARWDFYNKLKSAQEISKNCRDDALTTMKYHSFG